MRHAGFGAVGSRNLTNIATASAVVNGATTPFCRRKRVSSAAIAVAAAPSAGPSNDNKLLQGSIQNGCQYLTHQIAASDAARYGDASDLLPRRLMFLDGARD